MRPFDFTLRLAVFATAALGAWVAAEQVVDELESRSVLAVRQTLHSEGYQWAEVLGDGLQVILEGQAPAEAARFRAISLAGSVVDASRVIDNMGLADREAIAPPTFAMEILRNDTGISMIGLVPAADDTQRLAARVGRMAEGMPVTDLLETGDYPVPETWDVALDYAMTALRTLPRAKISVTADRVTVQAIADSIDEKRAFETALTRGRPQDVTVRLDISAPRPVISPFAVRLTMDDEEGVQFDACAADTAAALERIETAAREIGFDGRSGCMLALGAPSRTWGEAVALSIQALGTLGGGSLTVLDTDVTLIAREGVAEEVFDDAAGNLENELPPAFALTAERPITAAEQETQDVARFSGSLGEDGLVQLRGRLADSEATALLKTVAEAKFGIGRVDMRTRAEGNVPRGWAVRVLAATEALARLHVGEVSATPERLTVSGRTGNIEASAEISALLIERLGADARFDIDVTYEEALDPVAALPTPEECIEDIRAVTAEEKITFAPSSDRITLEAQGLIDEIAAILKDCGDLPIRIAGYTDSQGREEMNRQLSQSRAESVLTAIRARRVPTSTFVARGYGEENPIADNGTEEGREANRRIEFSLFDPEAEAEVEDAEPQSFSLAGEDSAPAEEELPPGAEVVTAEEGDQLVEFTVTTLDEGAPAPDVTPRLRPEGLGGDSD